MASEGFTFFTRTTSLTFDLPSDQEQLRGNLQESKRGGSLSRMER